MASRFDPLDPSLDRDYCNALCPYEYCLWCGGRYFVVTGPRDHFPYCCSECATLARLDSAEDGGLTDD